MDQHSDGNDFDLAFELERLQYRNIPCFQTSLSSKGEEVEFSLVGRAQGMEKLKLVLAHKMALFMGQSGVGKSTLISALSEGKIALKSGQVGMSGKGKHTTTWSEVVESDTLTLIDSPGIRSFSLDDIREEELLEFFPELLAISTKCQFSNCGHLTSSRGCAFYGAETFSSQRERKVVLSYLDSYHRLLSEVSKIPSWQK